ncbi:integrase, catalytic region, zinc finger, CCHC-type containing protein [Tanacetum coccineum]
MIQPEPEDLPKDNPKLEIAVLRVILFSIHNDEWKSFQCHHQTALRNLHETTVPYTPQQYGMAKRKNRAFKEMHSKACRFYVIEPNDSVSINSIIESRDAIFDENRFSSIPRPKDIIPNSVESQRDDHSDDVPSEIPEPQKGKRVQKAKSYGSDFQLYLVEGSRDQVRSQYSYCYNIEEAPRTYNEAMKSRDATFWKEAIDDEIGSIMENNTWVLSDLPPGCKPLDLEEITSKPISKKTVYPPNTPARLVLRVLPTKSQVKINIYTLIQLFSDIDKTCKKRITPTGLTKGERGFEQTKECYLTEVILFFKTLKEHFEGIQQALTKEVKEMKEIFEQMEAEVDQNVVDKKSAEIERKNLLIENENLIADCLSKEVLYTATNYVLTVSRFSEMYDAYTVQARCLELKAEISKLKHKIQKDDYSEMIKHFSNLEANHLNFQLKCQHLKESFGNNKSRPAQDAPEFDSVFKINKMKASLQGKDNTIRKLKVQISQLKETRSEADRTLDFRALDFQIPELTKKSSFFKNKMSLLGQKMQQLTENENLKAQIIEKMKRVTMDSVKPKVLAPGMYAIDVEPIPLAIGTIGRTDRPLVFGLRLLKTYDGESLSAQEFCEKVHRTVRFGNDHFSAIMGYGDYVIDLEVAFRKHSCYVRNEDGVELLKGSRGSNLYTIFVKDMMKSSPICLLSKASKNKSWLWHRRLNHLNFGTINDLA